MVGLRTRLIAMLVIVMVLASVLMLVGVNYGLRNDVRTLAQQSADSGANALSQAIINRTDQVRDAVLQGSSQPAAIAAMSSGNQTQLHTIASEVALAADLSFVVVTDAKGAIIAGSRPASGSIASNPVVQFALADNPTGGFEQLSAPTLKELVFSNPAPVTAISMAAPIKIGQRIVGVMYGGTILDWTSKWLDETARITRGGAVGIVVNGKFVATSLTNPDSSKLVGSPIAIDPSVVNSKAEWTGPLTVDGTEYYSKATALSSVDSKVIGAMWFGVPNAQFTAIVNNTLGQIILWSVVGIAIALVVGYFVAERIGRAITSRSDEVNESARQLKVLVVGGEVSGDHVGRTRENLQQIARIVSAGENSEHGEVSQLRTLADQAVDDVLVIDTLTGELSTRMRDAASRVERLSTVAQELDELVAGARRSRN